MRFYEATLGCIAGAFVGDSCGSHFEFVANKLSEGEMDYCMSLPGGGPHGLNPGQITDDSELALCLMHALTESATDTFDLDVISDWYKKWANSKPFDIEENVNGTIMNLDADPDATLESIKKTARETDHLRNSCTNSALMHITPLAVWCAAINDL